MMRNLNPISFPASPALETNPAPPFDTDPKPYTLPHPPLDTDPKPFLPPPPPPQAEPIGEQELGKFFSAPGYYGNDVSAMCIYEKGR